MQHYSINSINSIDITPDDSFVFCCLGYDSVLSISYRRALADDTRTVVCSAHGVPLLVRYRGDRGPVAARLGLL